MAISEYFRCFLKDIQEEQTIIKFYHRIPDQQILPAGYTSQVFEPQQSYFEIRLAEMFLSNKREYWQGFIPLGVLLSDFLYNRQRQAVPFMVNNQILKGLEKQLEGQSVEYYNTRIAGPVPYLGDDVGLFVGLFRSKVEDLSKSLFSFLETLVGAFDFGQLTPYLKIAQQVRTGLENLLGFIGQGEVQYRLGNRDVFVDPILNPNDFKAFRDGYLVYINCPENVLNPDTLRVKEDRLLVQEAGSLEPLRSYDYCLVRLKSLPFRNDYTTFPWYGLWLEAVERIHQRDITGATGKLMDFNQKVRQSPDLTEKHQYELIAMFQGNFDKEVEIASARKGDQVKRAPTATRGVSGQFGAQETLQRTAYLAEMAGLDKEKQAVKVLWDVHQNWGSIPYLADRPENFDWTDRQKTEEINQLISDQLQAVSQISQVSEPDPQALADAMMAAYLSPG